MKTRAVYASGDQVLVVAGKYKGNTATYLSVYGKVMCSVHINGNINGRRNIWLTSIQHHNNTRTVDDREKEKEGKKGESKVRTFPKIIVFDYCIMFLMICSSNVAKPKEFFQGDFGTFNGGLDCGIL